MQSKTAKAAKSNQKEWKWQFSNIFAFTATYMKQDSVQQRKWKKKEKKKK